MIAPKSRCIVFDQPGEPRELRIGECDTPRPKADEVLIKVQAAGVNRADCYQRRGMYPPPLGASPILGLEVAGEIVLVGSAVQRWRVGERVCALVSGGAYAEYCSAHEGSCFPFPRGYDAIKAAALPETFMTVWSNVWQRVALQPGETLLVQGGSSGIGTTAIQLGKAFGHRVFATAGSPEKCAACEKLGAERGINYRSEDFVEVVKHLTGGKGVDVILDIVGGDYIAREMAALATDGRIVLIALQASSQATIDLIALLRKRLSLTASTLRARDDGFKARLTEAVKTNVWPLLESGKVTPVIHQSFPLEQAGAAHELMESSKHIGKIILTL
jgi:NADPH:quinone reductase